VGTQTFLQIKNNLISEMGRSDFDILLSAWVANVESKADRTLDFPINEQIFDQNIIANTEYIPLPTDHLTMRKVVLIVEENRFPLIYLTPTGFEERFPIVQEGTPTHYTVSGVNLRLGPKASQEGTVEILYQLRVEKLLLDEDTSNITIENSDIYFNGLAYEANIHFKDFDSAAVFKSRFEESISDANDRHFDRRYSGPVLMNLNGSFGG